MARVPGSSPAAKKATKAKKTASTKTASKSVKISKPKPTGTRGPSPTVVQQESLQVKIPHTEEGKLFLAKLHELLQTSQLPFKQICSPSQKAVAPKGIAAKSTEAGGTTYALDMRLEQEGWPPF